MKIERKHLNDEATENLFSDMKSGERLALDAKRYMEREDILRKNESV